MTGDDTAFDAAFDAALDARGIAPERPDRDAARDIALYLATCTDLLRAVDPAKDGPDDRA